MRTAVIIPARFDSSRFPGKPLALINGKPMIQWVYEACKESRVDEVWVATDDERILHTVRGFRGRVQTTSSHHQSGTDRVAELARQVDADRIINVQGDEPLVKPGMIDEVLALLEDPAVQMATLAGSLRSPKDLKNENVVKLILDSNGKVSEFFRMGSHQRSSGGSIYQHIGIYGFQRKMLFDFTGWEPTANERLHRLEQLRAVDRGVTIHARVIDHELVGVDTPEDLAKVGQLLV